MYRLYQEKSKTEFQDIITTMIKRPNKDMDLLSMISDEISITLLIKDRKKIIRVTIKNAVIS